MARGCRCGLGSVAARRMALNGTERLPGGPGGGPSRSTTRRPRTSGAHGLQVHDISTNRRTTATPTKVSVDNCSASWESLRTQPYLTALRTPRTPRLSPRDHEHVISGSPTRLSKGLKQRHLTMIAIGGVIGARPFRRFRRGDREHRPWLFPGLRPDRCAHRAGDADVGRNGCRPPVDRVVRRLRAPGTRRVGRVLRRLAVLVFLGHRGGLRGGRLAAPIGTAVVRATRCGATNCSGRY